MNPEKDIIHNTFNVNTRGSITEEQLIEVLAERIAELLDRDPDLLFSTFYRLDIAESKIRKVLHSPSATAAVGLARLVLERQREKLKTREEYRRDDDIPPDYAF